MNEVNVPRHLYEEAMKDFDRVTAERDALQQRLNAADASSRLLRPENQRITPARFKCLACGEYHEGSGNLPCPSMSPYSRIEQ